MATSTPHQQFSEEKILVEPNFGIGDQTPSQESTLIAASDEKSVARSDDKTPLERSSHADEKVTVSDRTESPVTMTDEKQAITHDSDKQALKPSSGTQVSISSNDKHLRSPSNDKQVFNTGEGKIATSTDLTPLVSDKSIVSPPSGLGRSQTDASWGNKSSASYHEHSFCHASALRLNHNVVVDPDSQATFFIEVSGLVKGREDVVVHQVRHDLASKGLSLTAEEGKLCPIVAFAQFPRGRDNFVQIGLGDHNVMSGVQWLDITRSNEHDDWSMTVPGNPSHTFHLSTNLDSPTSGMRLSPMSSVSSLGSTTAEGTFRLVDGSTGAVLAAYTELKTMSSWKKRGKLRAYDHALSKVKDIPEGELHLLTVICCAVMNEKRRRKTVRKWVGIGVV